MRRENQKQEPPETVVSGVLQTNDGAHFPYTLTVSDSLHDWEVFDDDRRIGYAWCILNGEEFALRDWKFEREVVLPQTFWARLVGCRPEVRSYRRRGLGTQLLPIIIDHARKLGAGLITGVISSGDLEEFPALPSWYARFGFIYIPTSAEGKLVGQVELRF